MGTGGRLQLNQHSDPETRPQPRFTRQKLQAEFKRLGRYLIVGGSMALLSASLLWLLTSLSDLPASLLAIVASLIVAPATYVLHRYYTFRSENTVSFEAAGFLAIVLMNYPLSILTVFVSVDLLGIHPFIGGLLANAAPPVVNYALHTRVVFSQRIRKVSILGNDDEH